MRPGRRRSLSVVFALSLFGQSTAEINIVSSNGFELHLTTEEQEALSDAPGLLISNPSGQLETAINKGQFKAVVLDQRGDASIEYPLIALIRYPTITVSESRTVRPSVDCKGTLYPVVWTSCVETSETHLSLPGFGVMEIQPESITKAEAESVLGALTLSLQSSGMKADRSLRIFKIRYRDDSDCYFVRGEANGTSFFAIVPPDRNTKCNSSEVTEVASRN